MQLTASERRRIVAWLANAAGQLRHDAPEAGDLAEWVAGHTGLLELEGLPTNPSARRDHADGVLLTEWRRLRGVLADAVPPAPRSRGDRIEQRLRSLGRELGLGRTDLAILEILLRYRVQPLVEDLVDSVFAGGGVGHRRPFHLKSPALASLLGMRASTVLGRVESDAPLVKSGLVSIDGDGDLELVDRLRRLARTGAGAGREACRLLFDRAPASDLEWADFEHVAEDRDQVERTLRGALDTGAAGVNILLYGPPGTGKTEFCRVLADRLGVALYSVGETDEDGHEPRRVERLQELRLAQGLLARSGRSLLLFDEMEDLLASPAPFLPLERSGSAGARGSKVFLNRLLEQNPAPTLWTSNSGERTCRTLLRRMMFAFELRPPRLRARARIWARQLAHHGIAAGAGEARALASEFEVTPGVVSEAVAAARLAGGGLEAVRRHVRSLCRVMGCEKPPRGTPERFDPALIRADLDPNHAGPTGSSGAAAVGVSPSASRGRPAPARARSSAISRSGSVSRSCRSAPPT